MNFATWLVGGFVGCMAFVIVFSLVAEVIEKVMKKDNGN